MTTILPPAEWGRADEILEGTRRPQLPRGATPRDLNTLVGMIAANLGLDPRHVKGTVVEMSPASLFIVKVQFTQEDLDRADEATRTNMMKVIKGGAEEVQAEVLRKGLMLQNRRGVTRESLGRPSGRYQYGSGWTTVQNPLQDAFGEQFVVILDVPTHVEILHPGDLEPSGNPQNEHVHEENGTIFWEVVWGGKQGLKRSARGDEEEIDNFLSQEEAPRARGGRAHSLRDNPWDEQHRTNRALFASARDLEARARRTDAEVGNQGGAILALQEEVAALSAQAKGLGLPPVPAAAPPPAVVARTPVPPAGAVAAELERARRDGVSATEGVRTA